MIEILLLLGILSKHSFGLPVDLDRNRPISLPLSSNFNLSNPAPESTRIYSFRGTHHPPNEGDLPPPPPRSVNSHSHENTDDHSHSQTHLDPYHHHDHDGHKGHKLSKLNIQQYITQRDIDKLKSKDSVWKTYFAEILAASLLVSGLLVFICWYNYTKVGRQRRTGAGRGPGGAREKRRMHRQNTFQRGQSMPELYINVNPVAPLPPNPKSSCVCSPEEPKSRGLAKHSWHFEADNFYPLNQAAKV